jgi:hypothetical protein
VHRGWSLNHNARGLAWTLDREVAVWFARRFAMLGGIPRVSTAAIRAERVLAYFTARGEAEIVVDRQPHSAQDGSIEALLTVPCPKREIDGSGWRGEVADD